MTDHAFQPISAAVRRINTGEGDALRGFLASDLGLDEWLSSQGIDPAAAQQAMDETGITVPEAGLGNKYTGAELTTYTNILQGDQSFSDAAVSFGFDAAGAADSLADSGLRVPLQKQNREIFDLASEFGFTSTDVSRELGVEKNDIDTTLAAAGLDLPGNAFSTTQSVNGSEGDPTRGSNLEFLDGAFNGVPQAPGVKLGFGKQRSKKNPNIKSGPRGVTQSGSIRHNVLKAGKT